MAFFKQFKHSVLRFARHYDRLLTAHPLPVKCVTSGVVVGSSDAVVQLCTTDDFSFLRTLVVGGGYGALWFAPVMHCVTTTWSRVLPATTVGALVCKTLVDMTTVFPVNVSVMLGLNCFAREPGTNHSVASIQESIQQNFWPSYSKGWLVWPFVGVTMYRFVPLPYRVLYINSVSFFWNGYLCFRFDEGEQATTDFDFDPTVVVEVVKPMERFTALRSLPDSLSPMQTDALIARTNETMQVLYKDWSNNRNPE